MSTRLLPGARSALSRSQLLSFAFVGLNIVIMSSFVASSSRGQSILNRIIGSERGSGIFRYIFSSSSAKRLGSSSGAGAPSAEGSGSLHFSPMGTPRPSVVHKTLTRSSLKDRVVIVGDVHGCLDELKLLLEKTSYDARDTTLIFVGDLVNKGPFSLETLRLVRQLSAHCVRGNHDDACLSQLLRYRADGQGHSLPPHYSYVKELSDADLQWLADLPYTLTLPSLSSIVVHAGVNPALPLEAQLPADMYSIRNVVSPGEDSESALPPRGSAGDKEGVAWATYLDSLHRGGVAASGSHHVYFGHDAKRGLQLNEWSTGLDTGCCYGKLLTAAVITREPSGGVRKEIVSVNALRQYEEPKARGD